MRDGTFEMLAERAQEPAGRQTVDESMIGRQGKRQHLLHDQRAAGIDPRRVRDAPNPDDRRLWAIQDRGEVLDPRTPEVAERERAAGELADCELALACACDQVAPRGRQGVDGHVLRVEHRRGDETPWQIDCEAEMERRYQLETGRRFDGVQQRMPGQNPRQGLSHQVFVTHRHPRIPPGASGAHQGRRVASRQEAELCRLLQARMHTLRDDRARARQRDRRSGHARGSGRRCPGTTLTPAPFDRAGRGNRVCAFR
jgi:hypothetical protein